MADWICRQVKTKLNLQNCSLQKSKIMNNIKNQSEENNFESEHKDFNHADNDCGHVHKHNNDDCNEHVNKNHHHGHHDEHQCCNHNHEHEHHCHEHDDCGNGHTNDSHKHYHKHDDCCDHDHNEHDHHHHEHSHGHTYNVPGFLTFESHTHEGATICSFEKQSNSDYDEAYEKMNSAVLRLRDELNNEGHIIGHLKGFIKQNGEVTTFSTVGADLTVQKHSGAGVQISFAAIVFGPDEETLKDRLADCFAGI